MFILLPIHLLPVLLPSAVAVVVVVAVVAVDSRTFHLLFSSLFLAQVTL